MGQMHLRKAKLLEIEMSILLKDQIGSSKIKFNDY
jgi:hypothetical protein